MRLTILAHIGGYDIELTEDNIDTPDQVFDIVSAIQKNGSIIPRPRWQKQEAAAFEPFNGTITKIEDTKTKNGKDMYIAFVTPAVAEGEQPKDAVPVKYMPPKQTWRLNDAVHVSKNDKGWLELSEQQTGDNTPF